MHKNVTLKSYLFVIIISLLVALGVCFSKDFFALTAISDKLKVLSDAFFLPGVFLTCLSGLVFVSNDGFFAMLTYGTRRMISYYSKNSTFRDDYKTYYDYYSEKTSTKVKFGFILYPGLAFLSLAIVFNVIFNFYY